MPPPTVSVEVPEPARPATTGLPVPLSAILLPAESTIVLPSRLAASAIGKPIDPLEAIAIVIALFLGTATM